MTRLLLALLASSLVAGCSGGIGGTGSRADGGIGGTGAPAGGIAASGEDITLFGVITAFGSIWVNGVEVHYDRATPVELNGAPELAIGQTVLVEARPLGGGQARAASIRVAEAVVGTVTADGAGGVVQVEGRRVRIDASTVLGPGVEAAPKSGETLRVSGLATADGTIAATRLERARPGERSGGAALEQRDMRAPRFVVEGYVGEVAARELRVGALTFASEGPLAGSIARDQLVRVSGRNDNGRLVLERAERLSGVLPPRGERPGARPGTGERGERGERGGGDRPERSGPERPERPDRGGGGGDRPDRPDRSGRH